MEHFQIQLLENAKLLAPHNPLYSVIHQLNLVYKNVLQIFMLIIKPESAYLHVLLPRAYGPLILMEIVGLEHVLHYAHKVNKHIQAIKEIGYVKVYAIQTLIIMVIH